MAKFQTVVLSNRGPLSFKKVPDGSLTSSRGGGGLVSGFLDTLTGKEALWISAISNSDDIDADQQGLFVISGITLHEIVIDPETYRSAYDVVSNQTLWYIYHNLFYAPIEPIFDLHFDEAFARYRNYSSLFAEAVIEYADNNATVIVNDYHLSLVPRLIKVVRPDINVVFFTHTPFPTPSEFAILPFNYRTELIDSISHANKVGFHASKWAKNYLDNETMLTEKRTRVFISPLPSDQVELQSQLELPEVETARLSLETMELTTPLILRVDRMELSKNILRGFLAVEEMMIRWPLSRGKFSFLALCYPSRETLTAYIDYREKVEKSVDRINLRFGTPNWKPIHLITEDNYPRSLAAFERFDVLLVNPIRDGLNLVAQEGLFLNKKNGVVILSDQAGSVEVLEKTVLTINPFDVSQTASALYRACFQMSDLEKFELLNSAQGNRNGLTPQDWIDELLSP